MDACHRRSTYLEKGQCKLLMLSKGIGFSKKDLKLKGHDNSPNRLTKDIKVTFRI